MIEHVKAEWRNIHNLSDGSYIDNDGNICHIKNGKKHREDGPAEEYANGSKFWYRNGGLHREDGPAVELDGGYKSWVKNGEYHREDGPAKEYANGDKEWYRNEAMK